MLGISARAWCRAGFIGWCVLPTLFTVAWAGYSQTPLYRERCRARWEATLTQHLSVPVRVESAEPGPAGAMRLNQVQLLDWETHAVIGEARGVWVEPRGSGWRIEAAGLRIEQGALRELAHAFHEQALRRAVRSGRVTCRATDVTLASTAGSMTLAELNAAWEAHDGGPLVEIALRLAGSGESDTMRLSATRDRNRTPAATRWRLDTQEQWLPVTALPEAFPEFALCGERCLFQGIAEWTTQGAGWSASVEGAWHQIDLDRCTERLPHKLSGLANVELRHARFEQGRLVDAQGALRCRGGVVSRLLLATSADERTLGMAVAERVLKSREPLLRYRQLEFEFTLSADGLQLAGRCTGQPPGTLMADSQGPLVQDSARPLVPSVALVRTLAPASEVQVPAGIETEGLLRRLPLPSLEPPAELAERPPSTRVRLR